MRLACLAALGLVFSLPAPAFACTMLFCKSVVHPASGTLPANMLQLLFTEDLGSGGAADNPERLRLFRMDGANKSAITYSRESTDVSWEDKVRVTAALPVGSVIALEADPPKSCTFSSAQPLSATYTVTEAKPLPKALGMLSATPGRAEITVAGGAQCFVTLDASFAELQLELSTDAQPYGALFRYDVLVDGTWNGRLQYGEGRARGRVFTPCGKKTGAPAELDAGTHAVIVEGTLPDGTKVRSPELSVTLRCESLPAPERPDAGLAADDRAALDAAVDTDSMTDAASRSDAGSNASRDGSVKTARTDGGFVTPDDAEDGCALASRSSGLSGLLIALALRLRRRRS